MNQTNAQVNADTTEILATEPGSTEWLIAVTNASAFTFTSKTLDANEAITTGTVTWPDGTAGVFTTTTASSTFPGAVDAFTLTYIGTTTKTVTQGMVTRNTDGVITAKPQPTVA